MFLMQKMIIFLFLRFKVLQCKYLLKAVKRNRTSSHPLVSSSISKYTWSKIISFLKTVAAWNGF